jgi:hypothetical protein
MSAESRIRPILWLVARFVVLAPVCLVAWWLVVPHYGRLTGEAALLLLGALGYGFERVVIEAGGVLNTQTTLAFVGEARQTRPEHVAELATNMAPFAALVLATPKLSGRRRLAALGIGAAALFVSHILLIVAPGLAPEFVRTHPEMYHAFGVFSLLLPIVLWFAVTYGSPFWGQVLGEADDDHEQGAP